MFCFFFSSRRRHTRYIGDWSSDVCSSDLGLELRVDEDERPPRPDAGSGELDPLEVEPLGARRRPKAAVEAVRPGVVVALERLAPPVALTGDLGAAVTAHVDEGVEPAVGVAGDDDRDAARARGEERPWLGHELSRPGVLPGAVEDAPELVVEVRRLDVPGGGKRLGEAHGAGEIVPPTTQAPATVSKSIA